MSVNDFSVCVSFCFRNHFPGPQNIFVRIPLHDEWTRSILMGSKIFVFQFIFMTFEILQKNTIVY